MDASQPQPLDSAARVQPIHPSIPEVRLPTRSQTGPLPGSDDAQKEKVGGESTLGPATNLHPVTLRPFTIDELRSHNLEALLHQFPTPEAAKKEIEVTVKELRKLLDENERKTREIERELEEKEKTREIERKVYARKLGKDG